VSDQGIEVGLQNATYPTADDAHQHCPAAPAAKRDA
jgi:hypothetical protein